MHNLYVGSCLPFNEAEEDDQPGQEQAEGQVQLDISQVTQGLQERNGEKSGLLKA